ncbi:MAG: NusG domain II-containing protein [Candidatus Riflebacteria bacterium]|nr:NusG domain II-containing protein [Candidatus Riflebacteria bacterium]
MTELFRSDNDEAQERRVAPRFLTMTDIRLCVFLVVISLMTWLASRSGNSGSAWHCRVVSIASSRTVDRVFSTIPASPLEVSGRLGTSTLEWDKMGRVRFIASPCPHHVCIGQGWTSPPFSVACVPNGILVEFPSRHPNDPDGISR